MVFRKSSLTSADVWARANALLCLTLSPLLSQPVPSLTSLSLPLSICLVRWHLLLCLSLSWQMWMCPLLLLWLWQSSPALGHCVLVYSFTLAVSLLKSTTNISTHCFPDRFFFVCWTSLFLSGLHMDTSCTCSKPFFCLFLNFIIHLLTWVICNVGSFERCHFRKIWSCNSPSCCISSDCMVPLTCDRMNAGWIGCCARAACQAECILDN